MTDADDLPLAALAATKPKPPAPKGPASLDDDTPLASLASLRKPAGGGGRPSTGAKPGAPPRGSPPKGRPSSSPKSGQKRKSAGSSSDSSTSSDSDSSSSDDKPMKAKRAKGAPKARASRSRPSTGATTKQGGDDGEEGDGSDEEDNQIVRGKVRTVKEQVVAELLCRWWYVLPDWPPTEESYYTEQLKKKGLRKVTIQEWEWVAEEDSNGLRKCYELSAYRGLVRDSAGELIDLRPQETAPCQRNLLKKDLPELYALCAKAYENQLEELKKSRYDETQLRVQLQAQMTKVRNKANQAAGLTGSARKNAGNFVQAKV